MPVQHMYTDIRWVQNERYAVLSRHHLLMFILVDGKAMLLLAVYNMIEGRVSPRGT